MSFDCGVSSAEVVISLYVITVVYERSDKDL